MRHIRRIRQGPEMKRNVARRRWRLLTKAALAALLVLGVIALASGKYRAEFGGPYHWATIESGNLTLCWTQQRPGASPLADILVSPPNLWRLRWHATTEESPYELAPEWDLRWPSYEHRRLFYTMDSSNGLVRLGEHVVIVPLWLLGALTLLVMIASEMRRKRFPAGACQQCGYDLRGNTSGACPECGAAIPPKAE